MFGRRLPFRPVAPVSAAGPPIPNNDSTTAAANAHDSPGGPDGRQTQQAPISTSSDVSSTASKSLDIHASDSTTTSASTDPATSSSEGGTRSSAAWNDHTTPDNSASSTVEPTSTHSPERPQSTGSPSHPTEVPQPSHSSACKDDQRRQPKSADTIFKIPALPNRFEQQGKGTASSGDDRRAQTRAREATASAEDPSNSDEPTGKRSYPLISPEIAQPSDSSGSQKRFRPAPPRDTLGNSGPSHDALGSPSSSSTSSSLPSSADSSGSNHSRSSRSSDTTAIDIEGITVTPYDWRQYADNDAYDMRVNFQRMIIVMVLRRRDGGRISSAAARLLRVPYFHKPWKKAGKTLLTVTSYLSRRSWDTLFYRILEYPILTCDAIATKSACEGCGHEHAACYSYSECKLHGLRYCPDTFARPTFAERRRQEILVALMNGQNELEHADRRIQPDMFFTLGTGCRSSAAECHAVYHLRYTMFREFEAEHFGAALEPALADMMDTSPIPIDRIVQHFDINGKAEEFRTLYRTKLYLIQKRRANHIRERKDQLANA